MKGLLGIAVAAALILTIPAAGEEGRVDLGEYSAMIAAGKPAEARTRLRKMQALFHAKGDVEHEGICALLVSLADAALHNDAASRSDLGEAASKLQAAGDHFGASFAYLSLAKMESLDGQSEQAIAHYEKSLAELQHASESKEPLSLEAVRAMAPLSGMPAQLLDMIAGQAAIARMFLLPFSESMTRDAYAAALMDLGELDRAEEQLKRAASLSVIPGLFDISIDFHMGHLRRRQHRYDEARASYRKALDSARGSILPLPANELSERNILSALAELEVDAGRIDAALAWNDEKLKAVRGTPKHEADVWQERGDLLMRANQFIDAEQAYGEAMKLAEQLKDNYRIASIEGDRGTLSYFRGDYGRSATRLERSIALHEKVQSWYEAAPLCGLLAEDYFVLELPDAAAAVVAKGHELAKKANFPIVDQFLDLIGHFKDVNLDEPRDVEAAIDRWMQIPEAKGLMLGDSVSTMLHGLLSGARAANLQKVTAPMPLASSLANLTEGRKLAAQGDIIGAREAFKRGAAQNLNADFHAGYLALVGATYVREKNFDEAIRYFEQAAAAIENVIGGLKVDDLLASYLGSNRHWYFDILIELLVRNGRAVEAFSYSERARARAFLQVAGNSRVNPTRGADPVLVAAAEQLRREIAAHRDGDELEAKQKEYEALMLRVKASNAEYSSLMRVDAQPVENVQREIPADTSLISYFVSSIGIYAWVVDRDTIESIPLRQDAAKLQAVLCWADEFERTGDATRGSEPAHDPCSGPRATDVEAFEFLFAPLKTKIRHSRLILVPHGKLHYIPFAALRDPDTGRYLIEDYVLSYAPSASALRFILDKKANANGSALVMGDPQPAEPATALPAAACEAVSVAGDLGVVPLLGARATESLLYHLARKTSIVHIAAHAHYNAVSPLFSRVLLSPDAEQDGTLEVDDILGGLDLTGVDLMTLSACSTGIGRRTGGDEIVGLTRALLYAGSRSVISTLWNISDPASAELMEEFYKNLLAGAPAADALQAAQIAMSRSAFHGDPKYWAAFNLTGDPRVTYRSR